MKRLFAFLLTAALLTTPALAAGPGSRSPDPASCEHSFEASVVVEASCGQKGLLAYTCAKCGLTYTEEIPPAGRHEYELTETTATCTEPGEATYVCARCGHSRTRSVPAAGHVPDEGPTCIRPQCCTVCGEVLAPAIGHDFVYQYDASFDSDGALTSYGTWVCANCGSVMAATEGNALYYYGGDAAPEGEHADGSSTDAQTPAPAEPEDKPAPSPAQVREDDGREPDNGLWIGISAAALVIIVAEAVALIRSLKKNKTTL